MQETEFEAELGPRGRLVWVGRKLPLQRKSWQPALYVPRGDTQAGFGGLLAGMSATHFATPLVRIATGWPIAFEASRCPRLKNEEEGSQPANFFFTSLFFWP